MSKICTDWKPDGNIVSKILTCRISDAVFVFMFQTSDGTIDGTFVVPEDVAVYETVSALEQLSRGQVITSADGVELIQVKNIN